MAFILTIPSLDPKQRTKKSTLITDYKDWIHSGGKRGGGWGEGGVTTPCLVTTYEEYSTPPYRVGCPAVPDPTAWMKCDSCALDESKSSVIWKERGKRTSFIIIINFIFYERALWWMDWPLFCRGSRIESIVNNCCYILDTVQCTEYGRWCKMSFRI